MVKGVIIFITGFTKFKLVGSCSCGLGLKFGGAFLKVHVFRQMIDCFVFGIFSVFETISNCPFFFFFLRPEGNNFRILILHPNFDQNSGRIDHLSAECVNQNGTNVHKNGRIVQSAKCIFRTFYLKPTRHPNDTKAYPT